MEYPSAILFISDTEVPSTLYYCQENQIEVIEAHVYGWHCLILFDDLDVPNVIHYIWQQFRIIPFYMVGRFRYAVYVFFLLDVNYKWFCARNYTHNYALVELCNCEVEFILNFYNIPIITSQVCAVLRQSLLGQGWGG